MREELPGATDPFDQAGQRAILLEEARRSYDPGGVARQIAAIAVAGDRRARLAKIEAPTLVVHGTDDPLILPACGRDTAASIPNAVYLPVEGMGHDLPPEFEQVVADAICGVANRAIGKR